jgi:hypothetical protein
MYYYFNKLTDEQKNKFYLITSLIIAPRLMKEIA